MKILVPFVFAISCVFSSGMTSEQYLEGKIPAHNHRYTTLIKVLDLMKERGVKTMVETGTSRGGLTAFEGDGGSSVIFSQFATDHSAQFYSVDIDRVALNKASEAVKQVVGKVGPNLHFVQSDSIQFLTNFPEKIDFLYLDSYDFDFNDPLPSQMHHLREIEAAYPHLTPQTIIMIDDCDLPLGGKGLLVIEFLLNKGWTILEKQYQVILIHP